MLTMLETWGTRKSRSGMAVMWRAHLFKHGSAVQSTIALSSGESEYYALLRAKARVLGIKAMPNDWRYGVEFEIRMHCDSGMSARQGLGKTRQTDMRFLWQQQAVQEGPLKFRQVKICSTHLGSHCPRLMRIVAIGVCTFT